jgi:RHS repeat-associated protein
LQVRTGSTTTRYLYALGTRPLAQNSGSWEYLLPDALGSVRQIVDASGNVTLAESYEPYGTILTSNGTASSIFAYAGEQIDTYIKLLFLRARYLNPRLGIFMTEDTARGIASLPLSMHLYLYAWANPVNRIDPSGLQQPPPQCDFGDICATEPTGPYVDPITPWPTPPGDVPSDLPSGSNPPPADLLNEPTGYLIGYAAQADLSPIGIQTTDIQIGDKCFAGNSIIAGKETVWDFRHLQKADFTFYGIAQDVGPILGASFERYTGWIYGFTDSIRDYSGWFKTTTIGGGLFKFFSIGGMRAVSLDDFGNENPNGVTANYSFETAGMSAGFPWGYIGTSYTRYSDPVMRYDGAVRPQHGRSLYAYDLSQDLWSYLGREAGYLDIWYATDLIGRWGEVDPQ